MGEMSANPSAMRDYFASGYPQTARWRPEVDRLRETLAELWQAIADAEVPDDYRADLTAETVDALTDEFDMATAAVEHTDRYVHDVGVAVAAADGYEDSWPDSTLTVPASVLDDIGPADHSEVALPASLVEDLEQSPGYWDDLDPMTRQLLIEQYPARIGSIDGLPTEVRHEANLLVLEQEKEELLAEQDQLQSEVDALLADVGVEGIASFDELQEQTSGLHYHLTEAEYTDLALLIGRLEEVDGLLQATGEIESRIDASSELPAFLMGFGTEGIGQVILALGNPDHADNVATYVPGMNTTVQGVGDNVDVVDTMWSAAAEEADPTDATSVILWFDYDAPQGLGEARFVDPASDAAQPLRDFQAGLELSAINPTANGTVIGYSYGSTVVGQAATSSSLATDSIVLVGSSGLGVHHVSQLEIDPDRVYVTESAPELVRLVPSWILGPSPAGFGFGARHFPSDPGGHKAYFEPGNVFFDNLSAIITGQHEQFEPEPVTAEPTPRPDEVPEPTPSDGDEETSREPTDEPGPSPSPPGD